MAQHDARAIVRDWLARYADRLDTLPPVLQAEVISTVHHKASLAAMSDGRIVWHNREHASLKSGVIMPTDLDLCTKRVLSRARLGKFKCPPPEDPAEFRQQMATVAAALGVADPWGG